MYEGMFNNIFWKRTVIEDWMWILHATEQSYVTIYTWN